MTQLNVTPITENLEKYTFRQSSQIYNQTACIGYLRADLGSTGKEFHSTWNEISAFFKSDEFSKEFDEVINTLRFDENYGNMLSDRAKLSQYCHSNAKQYSGADNQYYGVRVDTDNYTYLLRLNPNKGEYNLYCYCYVRHFLENHLVCANKGIRFITPTYRKIFTIPDGDKIRIIYPNGDKFDRNCRYVDDYHTEIGGNLYHICEFAEIMEKNQNKVIPLRSSLPERCYGVIPSNDRLVIINKGEKNVTDVSSAYDSPEKNRELADGHNREMGITKQQAEAMLQGAVFGWEKPSADPQNYDDNGKLKPIIIRQRGEVR